MKAFTVELLIVLAIIAIIAFLFVVIWTSSADTEKLHQRYVALCEKDLKAENPYMDHAEIVERCEVAWEMAKMQEDKGSTTFIYMPTGG